MASTDTARLMKAASMVRPRLAWIWLRWTTAGEAAGFCVPAAVAAATAGLPTEVMLASLLLAGAVEGAILGIAQAHVLRPILPGLSRRRWVVATSLAATLAWLIGLLPSTLADATTAWPTAAMIPVAAAAGLVLLLSIGTAQWTVLRHHVPHASRWITITAAGWLAGLAAFMLIATPLWQEGQPPAVIIAIGVLAGLIMAATMALVTGLGLERLLAPVRTTGFTSRESRLERSRTMYLDPRSTSESG